MDLVPLFDFIYRGALITLVYVIYIALDKRIKEVKTQLYDLSRPPDAIALNVIHGDGTDTLTIQQFNDLAFSVTQLGLGYAIKMKVGTEGQLCYVRLVSKEILDDIILYTVKVTIN